MRRGKVRYPPPPVTNESRTLVDCESEENWGVAASGNDVVVLAPKIDRERGI